MNLKPLFSGLFALAALAAPVSVADTVAETPDASVLHTANKVGQALASLPLLNDVRPNTAARYYIYLCSAGWCGPCRAEMPHVVEAYQQIKQSGCVELLLVDFDHSEADAAKFISSEGVNFPATMATLVSNLPGFQSPKGIPTAIIVDAEGTVVAQGHGSLIRDWKSVISAYEKEQGITPSFPGVVTLTYSRDLTLAEVEPEAAETENTAEKKAKKKKHRGKGSKVSASLRKIKWFNAKLNTRAEYYIYLKSASWCGPCRAEMPKIAEQYEAMKEDGRVELVLLSEDQSQKSAQRFLSRNNASFPATMFSDKGVSKLPGVETLPEYVPSAAIVRADGRVVTSGHGSIVLSWRQHTIEAEGESAAGESDKE